MKTTLALIALMAFFAYCAAQDPGLPGRVLDTIKQTAAAT